MIQPFVPKIMPIWNKHTSFLSNIPLAVIYPKREYFSCLYNRFVQVLCRGLMSLVSYTSVYTVNSVKWMHAGGKPSDLSSLFSLFPFSAPYFHSFYVFVLSSFISLCMRLCLCVFFGFLHIPTEHILKPSHPSVHVRGRTWVLLNTF